MAQLVGTVTYYSFRLGENLLFTGPFGPAPPSSRLPSAASSPQQGSQHTGRGASPTPTSSASGGGGGRAESSADSDVGPDDGGFYAGTTPVSRAKAVASGAARTLLARGWARPTRWAKEQGILGSYSNGGGELGLYGSGTAPASESSSSASRRLGDSGAEGSRLERAVSEALDR